MGTRETRPGSFIGRRELLASGGMLATGALLPHSLTAGTTTRLSQQRGTNLYTRLGVRPLINCKGTYTIITGSQTLPEVKEAMFEASPERNGVSSQRDVQLRKHWRRVLVWPAAILRQFSVSPICRD